MSRAGPWRRPPSSRSAAGENQRSGALIPFRRPARLRLIAIWPIPFVIGFVAVWRTYEQVRGSEAAAPVEARPGDLVGRATVIDGDTIRVAGESVRLNGIDAPESRQTCRDERGSDWRCGAVAANQLNAYLAASRPLRCKPVSRDQYGRVIADCFRADGANIASWLVRNGLALDWPRFSKGRYAAEQSAAQKARVGLWRGSFQNPWDWRSAMRPR